MTYYTSQATSNRNYQGLRLEFAFGGDIVPQYIDGGAVEQPGQNAYEHVFNKND